MIKMEKIECLKHELAAKGSIIDYYRDTVALPNGNTPQWDVIEHKGAAAVVAVREDGKILLVRQYRYVIGQEILEIPAGGLNEGEPTKEAAARELAEETGYSCGKIEFLMSVFTTVAFCKEKIDIYLAEDLKPGKQHLDENEFINVEAYTVEELKQMIFDGVIQDGKTISAILTYAAKFGK